MRASGAYHKPTHDPESLILTLERGPILIIPLVRSVPPERLKKRPKPEKWSAHEHACHIATTHGLFFERLDRMLAQDNPAIKAYQPDQEEDDMLIKMDLDASLLQWARERGGSAPASTRSSSRIRCSSCSGTSRCTTCCTRTGSRISR